ncbi:MAG TPA: RNA-binding S4 domain-containing protein, partial [Ohtaekwangia sp.]
EHILYREIMEKFKLKEGEEYIALKDLIKLLGWADTGGEAMSRIDNREINVNGAIETQRRKKIKRGDVVMSGDNQAQVE